MTSPTDSNLSDTAKTFLSSLNLKELQVLQQRFRGHPAKAEPELNQKLEALTEETLTELKTAVFTPLASEVAQKAEAVPEPGKGQPIANIFDAAKEGEAHRWEAPPTEESAERISADWREDLGRVAYLAMRAGWETFSKKKDRYWLGEGWEKMGPEERELFAKVGEAVQLRVFDMLAEAEAEPEEVSQHPIMPMARGCLSCNTEEVVESLIQRGIDPHSFIPVPVKVEAENAFTCDECDVTWLRQ
jgi:hypothetical protein